MQDKIAKIMAKYYKTYFKEHIEEYPDFIMIMTFKMFVDI